MVNTSTRHGLIRLALLTACLAAGASARAGEDLYMVIADAFKITGKGVVVTGQITRGSLRVGDEVCLNTTKAGAQIVTVMGIEQFNKVMEEAHAGDAVGVLLSDVSRDDITAHATDSLSTECEVQP